jgi:KTSC domain
VDPTIAPVAYDAGTKILHLRFRKTGDVYRYLEFSTADYQTWLDSESRGRFFLAHIRDHFPY